MADNRPVQKAGLSLTGAAASRIVMLRIRKPAAETLDHIGRLLGTPLPRLPKHATGSETRIIWMGPNEWMLVEPGVTAAELEDAPGAAAVLAVEVGDGRFAIDFAGERARDFLARAVSIDLHPRAFPVDRSAMTLFAQVPVVIDHADDDRFRLWFDVSLRDYVRQWCDEALVGLAS